MLIHTRRPVHPPPTEESGGSSRANAASVLPLRRAIPLRPVSPRSPSQISGALARKSITHLMEEGKIRMITQHGAQGIYTRATNA